MWPKKKNLMEYIEMGDLDGVKKLVESGTNFRYDHDFPLQMAAYWGKLPIVRYLVEKGSDIHALDDEPLRSAVMAGYLDVVQYLVEHGADVHANGMDESVKVAEEKHFREIINYLKSVDGQTSKVEVDKTVKVNRLCECIKTCITQHK